MEVNAVEEKCDRRIELLTQSIKKTRKRARIEPIEEDDEEWVPSVLLHAEQTKVKVRELESCSSGSFLAGNVKRAVKPQVYQSLCGGLCF